MTIRSFALVTRAMRVESRSIMTYLMRAMLCGTIFLFLISAHIQAAWRGAPGIALFNSIIVINFMAIALVGLTYFANVITEEREELTLGLLRMTGLNSFTILAGKSLSRLLAAAILILVQFPFTLLAITLGGVSLTQILAAYATLIAFLLIVSAIGVFCSVLARTGAGAAAVALVFLLVFLLSPALFFGFAQWTRGAYAEPIFMDLHRWTLAASPFMRLIEIGQTSFGGRAIGVQVVSNVAATVVIYFLAWALFTRTDRQQKDAGARRGLPTAAVRRVRWLAPGRAWPNAIAWKDFFFFGGGVPMMMAKLVIYAILCFGIAYVVENSGYQRGWPEADTIGGTTMITMFILFLFEGGLLASRIFNEEVRNQTLGALVMLPRSTAAMAYTKVAVCLLVMMPSVLYFIVGAILAPKDFGNFVEEVLIEEPLIPWAFFTGHMLFLHLAAWLSLLMRSSILAFVLAGVIMFVGLWCSVTALAMIVMAVMWSGPDSEDPVVFMYGLVMLGLAVLLHVLIGKRLLKRAAG